MYIEFRCLKSLSSLAGVERRRFDGVLNGWHWAVQRYDRQDTAEQRTPSFERIIPASRLSVLPRCRFAVAKCLMAFGFTTITSISGAASKANAHGNE